MDLNFSAIGKTEAIYSKDDSQLTATAQVKACVPFPELSDDLKPLFRDAKEGDHVLATDQTVFYAQGGGQPADVGTMKSGDHVFSVKGVRKTGNGTILHVGTFAGQPFVIDSMVDQQVDEALRTLHSKIHDAGHIVSVAVRRLAHIIPIKTDLKARHYPDSAFVEFEGLIDGKHKATIEEEANKMVKDDLPIETSWWPQDGLAEKCWSVPPELVLPEGELARVVDIVGAGAYPCGGTHMRTTGLVGEITVRKISRQKGISKVSYALK